MSEPVVSDMIALARKSRGLTQTDLANLVGVNQATISRIELGYLEPTDEQRIQLGNALGYPPSFFGWKEPVYGLGPSMVYHRRRRLMSARDLDRIEALVNVRRLHIGELLKTVEVDDSRFLRRDLEEPADPVQAARELRAAWLVPRGPIKNLVALIEHAGGIVIDMDFGSAKIDGVGLWPPKMPPLFFISTNIPGDRQRFTLAHELGHIILHSVPSAEMEREADLFASEFLVPSDEFKPMVTDANPKELARLKRYWRVAMSALLIKARQVGKINQRRYEYLWTQMGQAGYRIKEPAELEIPRETPALVQEIIKLHLNDLGISTHQLADRLRLLSREFTALYVHANRSLRLVSTGPAWVTEQEQTS